MESRKNDKPFFSKDFASTPERAKEYDQNQERWKEFSTETINRFLKKLSTYISFREAIFFLADRRSQIANELQQGITDWYGSPRRKPLDEIVDLINQRWGEQSCTILEIIKKKVNNIHHWEANDGFLKYEDSEFTCTKYSGGEDVVYFELSVRNFSKEILDILFTEKSNPLHNIVRFRHLQMSDKEYEENMYIANELWEPIKNYSVKIDSPWVFLRNLAKLARFSANISFFSAGGSAITEWFIRAIAFSKGFWLGPFNHSEKIGWDFKAFCTFNDEEYAKWFSEKAFSQIIPIPESYIARGFSYEEPPFPALPLPIKLLTNSSYGFFEKKVSPLSAEADELLTQVKSLIYDLQEEIENSATGDIANSKINDTVKLQNICDLLNIHPFHKCKNQIAALLLTIDDPRVRGFRLTNIDLGPLPVITRDHSTEKVAVPPSPLIAPPPPFAASSATSSRAKDDSLPDILPSLPLVAPPPPFVASAATSSRARNDSLPDVLPSSPPLVAPPPPFAASSTPFSRPRSDSLPDVPPLPISKASTDSDSIKHTSGDERKTTGTKPKL